MCGIAALWGETDRRFVLRSLANLTHRGPDGDGLFDSPTSEATLGHRRLAIIDPAGGAQPIVSPDRSTALVANGMIYNDRELRRGLAAAPYTTDSDCETILHAYRDGGLEAVGALDGMFAFVLVDGEHLVAARDPIGIKPLYWGRRGEALCFASEIKALAGLAEDVEEFPAGHVYHSEHGLRRYYALPRARPQSQPVETIERALRERLEAAVVKRLRSDVPLGAFLSGGLDSSIVAALARRHVDELHTFAVGREGSADLVAARRVAEHLGTVHHEYVVTPEQILGELPAVLYHLESFDRDLVRSAVPCYLVARLAAEKVKVVLTGEGADELFAGYRYYRGYADLAGLGDELRRSITAMHDINLQRVDRMTMAHGLEARVPFLDTAMIELAMAIAPELKLRAGPDGPSEKWILRKAFADLLPDDVVWRDKEQFGQGSGFTELLAREAERMARARLGPAATSTLQAHQGRSAEEAAYRALMAQEFRRPGPVLDLVTHWNDHRIAA